MKYDIITILGPTTSGKTSLATRLALMMGNAEIISADSRQVYRGMDIGTGKDLADYEIEGVSIPYHLIDIADAGEKYNLSQFQQDFWNVYNDIRSRGKFPILCGGTGLYIESVLKSTRWCLYPRTLSCVRNLRDVRWRNSPNCSAHTSLCTIPPMWIHPSAPSEPSRYSSTIVNTR